MGKNLGSTPAPGIKRDKDHHEKRYVIAVPEDRPRLAVVYQHGVMQMMRYESDTGVHFLVTFSNNFGKRIYSDPIIIQMEKMIIVSARWSPDGTMVAVAGNQLDLPDGERNVVHFITAYGEVGYSVFCLTI